MRRIVRLIDKPLRYGVPVLMALLVIAALVEHFRPWPIAVAALREYPDQTPIIVGFRYNSVGEEWERSAQYILVPSIFTQPRVITVHASSKAAPTVSVSSDGIFANLMFVLIGTGVSLWLWLRPRKTLPDNTIEGDAHNGRARPPS